MARKLRVFVEKASQHIILKSINEIILFKDKTDYTQFLSMIKDIDLHIDIHSFVLMPTYFEFLATPSAPDTLSKFMQSLGRKYVGYFNKKYNRAGTLWEGRYKSSIVEDSTYLFDVMRYIESQPVKQKLVLKVQDYRYSSIHKNLFGKTNSIVSYHELYKELGSNSVKRIEKYSNIFHLTVDENKEKFIESCLDKQLVTGSGEFTKKLEQLTGISLASKSRGRPKKQTDKKGNKMYKNLVVLDRKKHSDLKMGKLKDLSFAKKTAYIPVLTNEISTIATDFPIVFTTGETPSIISLLSLGGDCLGINADNKWITKHIPLYFRQYPFALMSPKDKPEQKVVLIDEESPFFSKSKGEQLYKDNGEQSKTLAKTVDFLVAHEKQTIITTNLAKAIADSGILEDREISIGEGDEQKVLVDGFKVVNKKKLNALSDEVLADWVRKGIIDLINIHLKSLDNIQTLFDIAQKRQS